MKEIRNVLLSTEEQKRKYDATLKELLSNRQFLARILKRFAKEFKDIPIQEIEKHCIEPGSILVSAVSVERNLTNIEGLNTEDKTINEGTVFYDILFKAAYPERETYLIGIYVNLEIQSQYYPGYPIETRGIYYAARRLSSQLRAINKSTNYSALQKVYSIWLCTGNVPSKAANTVTSYHMTKENLIGSFKGSEKTEPTYDLIQIIIIRINDKIPCTDHTMQLLQILCSSVIHPKDKISWLKNHGIRVDNAMEGAMEKMRYISDEIEERGLVKGRREGRREGRRKEQEINRKEMQLISSLLHEGKTEEARRAADDREYRKQLLKLYRL